MEEKYYTKQNIKNIKKINLIISNLPSFVEDYFISLETLTTTLTRLNYARDIDLFFSYLKEYIFLKEKKEITLTDLENITANNIEKYLSFLTAYNLDGKTYMNSEKGKARKLASIRSMFKYLFNKDFIKKNVTTKVSTPKIRTKEIIKLEVDEIPKILNQVENPNNLSAKQQSYNKHTCKRDLAILTLFLGTGIRVSELVGLNIDDIDFNNNAFKITRKGGNQTVLYFSEEVKKAIASYMSQRIENEKAKDESALFLSLQNKRISVRAVEKLVKKYTSVTTPLKKISPHKLRSTYGTNLYHETKDIYIVADVLGHKDVNTTKKHYASISDDIRRDAANKVILR